jgi:hypothetical protein
LRINHTPRQGGTGRRCTAANRPRRPAGSSPIPGQTCRTRGERCCWRPNTWRAPPRYDLPAGLRPLPRDSDNHDPAVNAGGVRSVSPRTSSGVSTGSRLRSAVNSGGAVKATA